MKTLHKDETNKEPRIVYPYIYICVYTIHLLIPYENIIRYVHFNTFYDL